MSFGLRQEDIEDYSPLPYLIDIVDYTHLQHKELREHIERIGKVIYIKNR